jgi:MFS family permease
MTLFIYVMSCIGLAFAPNYTTLLILRMLQAFGSSSVIAIGAGTIGKERNQGQFVCISHSAFLAHTHPFFIPGICVCKQTGDIAGPSERGGYMGIYGLGSMLGPILGPVMGGTISSTLGWR